MVAETVKETVKPDTKATKTKQEQVKEAVDTLGTIEAVDTVKVGYAICSTY